MQALKNKKVSKIQIYKERRDIIMAITKLEKMINPEVMADMISAKVAKKVAVIPFAKMDTTLQKIQMTVSKS